MSWAWAAGGGNLGLTKAPASALAVGRNSPNLSRRVAHRISDGPSHSLWRSGNTLPKIKPRIN
jgi:hypothetical protein